MDDSATIDPQSFWEDVLSRQPERVRAAFANLSDEEKQAVLAHLKRMASEAGWHVEQRESAKTALEALVIG